MTVRLAVFASGNGSNLQVLIDRFRKSDLVKVALVVSDKVEAGALQRAKAAGIATAVIDAKRHEHQVAADILRILDDAKIDLVALAGYLKLVPADVVRTYRNRIINIHPAWLPAFGGKGMYGQRVHEAVLASGAHETGATVHYVTEHYDEGSIIAQRSVPVLEGDTAETLAARVLETEHELYPEIVEQIARGICRQH